MRILCSLTLYDVWPDANEFLMVAADESARPGLHVVINWMAQVRRQLTSLE